MIRFLGIFLALHLISTTAPAIQWTNGGDSEVAEFHFTLEQLARRMTQDTDAKGQYLLTKRNLHDFQFRMGISAVEQLAPAGEAVPFVVRPVQGRFEVQISSAQWNKLSLKNKELLVLQVVSSALLPNENAELAAKVLYERINGFKAEPSVTDIWSAVKFCKSMFFERLDYDDLTQFNVKAQFQLYSLATALRCQAFTQRLTDFTQRTDVSCPSGRNISRLSPVAVVLLNFVETPQWWAVFHMIYMEAPQGTQICDEYGKNICDLVTRKNLPQSLRSYFYCEN